MNERESRSFAPGIFTRIEPRWRLMIVRYRGRASRAISSAGERFVHTEEVTGSIPVSPTHVSAGQTTYSEDHRYQWALDGPTAARHARRTHPALDFANAGW